MVAIYILKHFGNAFSSGFFLSHICIPITFMFFICAFSLKKKTKQSIPFAWKICRQSMQASEFKVFVFLFESFLSPAVCCSLVMSWIPLDFKKLNWSSINFHPYSFPMYCHVPAASDVKQILSLWSIEVNMKAGLTKKRREGENSAGQLSGLLCSGFHYTSEIHCYCKTKFCIKF